MNGTLLHQCDRKPDLSLFSVNLVSNLVCSRILAYPIEVLFNADELCERKKIKSTLINCFEIVQF